MRMLSLPLALGLLTAPLPALACGGLFCNAVTPVNQAAERILFAVDGEQVHMHVRITYQGPPTDFGWLLPAPRGVETSLSSELLFTRLDQNAGPVFQLTTVFEEGCDVPRASNGGAEDGDFGPDAGAGGDPGVEVLSRQNIGPYDRAILEAENVAALRAWLDENGFEVPDAVDEKLQPYIDAQAVFVAIKLLPGEDSGDIVPLHLSFPGNVPSIPIVPTSVAANPDMGIIVHVLGQARAIPLNYLHVQINEGAIDWVGGGQNYPDVVSQAADEAGGHAFTTDYAGTLGPTIAVGLQPIPEQAVTELAEARTLQGLVSFLYGYAFNDADAMRVARQAALPEGTDTDFFFQCPDCGAVDLEAPLDGAALAAQVRDEVNAPREGLLELLNAQPYLTRLYSTMSPEEMDRDPLFAFNADQPEVPNVRTATQTIGCLESGEADFANAVIETASGVRVQLAEGQNPQVIRRSEGMTVAMGQAQAALVVERIKPEVPESEIVTDNRGSVDFTGPGGGVKSDGGDSDGGGILCSARPGAGGSALGLVAAALLGLGARRRRGARP
jgi:hypothetical protein